MLEHTIRASLQRIAHVEIIVEDLLLPRGDEDIICLLKDMCFVANRLCCSIERLAEYGWKPQ